MHYAIWSLLILLSNVGFWPLTVIALLLVCRLSLHLGVKIAKIAILDKHATPHQGLQRLPLTVLPHCHRPHQDPQTRSKLLPRFLAPSYTNSTTSQRSQRSVIKRRTTTFSPPHGQFQTQLQQQTILGELPWVKVLKRIPKSAREQSSVKLGAILADIVHHNLLHAWEHLFHFPTCCLTAGCQKRKGHWANHCRQQSNNSWWKSRTQSSNGDDN